MKKYRKFFILSIILTAFLFSIIMLFGDYLIKKFPLSYKSETEIVFFWLNKKKEINSKYNNADTIILLSGSNTLFGVNSDLISKETKKSVINLGLHGGLGDYTFDFAKTILKPKNTVIIPVEFDVVTKHKTFSDFKTQYIISEDKEYYKKLSLKDKMGCINFFINNDIPSALLDGQKKEEKYNALKTPDCEDNKYKAYSHKCWSKRGDVVFNTDFNNEKIEQLKNTKINTSAPVELSPVFLNFAKWCKKENIKLYVIYPVIFPYQNRNTKEAQEYFIAYKNAFIKNNIDFIGNPEDSFLEYEDFYDTVYHLNQKGVQKRSRYLIKIIKEEILND